MSSDRALTKAFSLALAEGRVNNLEDVKATVGKAELAFCCASI